MPLPLSVVRGLPPGRPRRTLAALGAGALLALTACAPAAPVPQPTPGSDDYAVVRATAEAAYQSGKAALERGELEAALVYLDQAKVHDPDNRADIQAALDDSIRRIQAQPPAPTKTPAPTPSRSPGVAPASPFASPTAGTAAAPATPSPSAADGLVAWRDDRRGLRLDVPSNWGRVTEPVAPVGTPVAAFQDPAEQALVALSVDESTNVVSPELYAARLDLAAQSQSSLSYDAMQPASGRSGPQVRRTFTLRETTPSGERLWRGLQVIAVQGGRPIVLTATASADRFGQYSATFERIADSLAWG